MPTVVWEGPEKLRPLPDFPPEPLVIAPPLRNAFATDTGEATWRIDGWDWLSCCCLRGFW